jgi:hypothetical protein
MFLGLNIYVGTIGNQIGRKIYWDLETCRKSYKMYLRTDFVFYFSVTVIVIGNSHSALCNVYPVALDSTRR